MINRSHTNAKSSIEHDFPSQTTLSQVTVRFLGSMMVALAPINLARGFICRIGWVMLLYYTVSTEAPVNMGVNKK
jgi:hypothetical protein